MVEPEIKTMKKDMEEIMKKLRTSGSLSEPIAKKTEALKQSKKEVSEPPKDLPTAGEHTLPGAPVPTEPIFSTASTETIEPTESTEPTESFKPLEPAAFSPPQTREEKPRRKKLFILVILLVILLLVGAGFYYWKYLSNKNGGVTKAEVDAPISLISTESIEVINIKEGKESGLLDKLQKDANGFQEKNTFRRILIKKIGKTEDYYPSFEETFKMLGISVPKEVAGDLKESYTLFIYAQEEGNRMGALIQIDDVDNIRNSVNSWEESMPNDLLPMFLGEELDQPLSKNFSEIIYRGANIRYLNFPNSIFSVDYTIIKDYLVLTTSKESMEAVINRILEGE